MEPRESDSPAADDPRAPSRFNPRLVPPLILGGLLLIVGLLAILSRGGPPKDAHGEKVEGRLVRKVEQTPKFTYLELAPDTADDKGPRWLATGHVEVEVGDRVYFEPEGAQEARNFPAPSLKRTFDRILLVHEIFKVGADGRPVALRSSDGDRGDSLEAAHGHGGTMPHGGALPHGGTLPSGGMGPHGAAAATDVKIPQLSRVNGGQTLAEIAATPEKFGGREIKIRGIIIKAQQRVRPALDQPATNWYRLQDSSGAAEPLLFTTDDAWQQGDIVVIAGKLTLDRDFGGGLRYKMIVERPSVTREKAAAAAEAPAKTAGPDPKTKG